MPDSLENIGLCLSGGGSRAVAFHLGCMRALNELKLLSKVKVISTVSGGSVIGALYAYEDDAFEEFEKRVRSFLVRGLARDATRRLIFTGQFILGGFNLLTVLFAEAVNALFRLLPCLRSIQFFPRRRFNRTRIISQVLGKRWLKEKRLSDVARPNIEIVINATELQTNTAFRFGSREVSCWRYGKASSDQISVSDAVAASAAYPALLPALDREYLFTKGGHSTTQRVVLTDGGIYENLGVTPLLPGRSKDIGFQCPECRVIIACDAGSGPPDGSPHQQWMLPRLTNCFETVMRRVQSMSFKMLHDYRAQGTLDQFFLAYLGQDDSRLAFPPNDLVSRERVAKYPTNFSAMTEENIELLSRRGEQLMRSVIQEHLARPKTGKI